MSDILLSICMPTYNRAEKLRFSLLAILKQVINYQDCVEVIVSNNASTDSTLEILLELKIDFPFLKIFSNPSNLGPNLNFFKLSDAYASGKYFWLIGDDDVIDQNALGSIIRILNQNPDVPFVGLNFRVLPQDKIYLVQKEEQRTKLPYDKIQMHSLINKQCRPENMLATFISCNIVLLNDFRNYDKSKFSKNSWDNFESLFPHTHIISSVIEPNQDVIYIEKPLISVILSEKEWDDKLSLISIYYIIDVFANYVLCGYKPDKLRKAKNIIIDTGIGVLFNSRVKIKYKWSFLKFVLIDRYFYLTFSKKIIKRLKF